MEQLVVSNLAQELLAVSKIETNSIFEPTVSQELIVASKTGTTSSFEPT
jgi:hypothetical protein